MFFRQSNAKSALSNAGAGRPIFYALVLLLVAYVHLALIGYAEDDAYIHFRIAENFITCGVPYYNPGDALMSSSSSGWTVVLYALFIAAGVSVTAVSLLNSAATVACSYVFSAIARELSGVRNISTDMLISLAVIPPLLLSSIGLMETPLSLFVLGAGVLLFVRGNALSFLLFGASIFFRAEFIVFAAVFAVVNVYSKRIPVWKMCLYALAGAAPFIVYNYWFFGTNIPHTVKAKSAVFVLSPSDVVQVGMPGWLLSGSPWIKVELILVAMTSYITARLSLKPERGYKDGVVLGMTAGGVIVFLAYLMKRVYIFEWYTPIYFVPLFAASVACFLRMRSALVAATLALSLFPFAVLAGKTVYASVIDQTVYPKFMYNARVTKLIDVAERLYSKYPEYTLLSSEIGGLGFAFKGQIYDGVGLVSENAVKYHPMKVPEERMSGFFGSIPAGYVREVMPDLIVSYDLYLDAVYKSDILDDYILIKEDRYMPGDMAAARLTPSAKTRDLSILIRKDRV